MNASPSSLRLTYRPDNAARGEVTVMVATEGFSGQGSAWFDRTEIEDFIAQLENCVTSDDPMPALAGGFFSASRLIDEHVGLRILPHDTVGRPRVRVHVATIVPSGSGADLRQELTASFVTTAADVTRFREALTALLAGSAREAVLEGRR